MLRGDWSVWIISSSKAHFIGVNLQPKRTWNMWKDNVSWLETTTKHQENKQNKKHKQKQQSK